jgi:hypothetical protein
MVGTPPRQTVVRTSTEFRVLLVQCRLKKADMDFEAIKAQANAAFAREEYRDAIRLYTKVCCAEVVGEGRPMCL